MRTLRRLAFGLPWLLAAGALGQVPESLRVALPESEAARLAPLFPPGTKLFMLPGALESTRSVSPDAAEQDPRWFGGLHFGSTTLSGNEFQPVLDALIVRGLGYMTFTPVGTQDRFALATLHLDTGVLWDGVLWWSFDDSTEDMGLLLYELCHPFSPGEPVATLLGGGGTSGTGGNHLLFTGIASPVTIQNSLCSYYMVLFATGVDANLLRFDRGRAGWFRQVSPAPVAATFTDVPTTHPFFRFVEALFASGITAGCGGGNFCPDSPLTRGEMAVFLAAALGLHFPF